MAQRSQMAKRFVPLTPGKLLQMSAESCDMTQAEGRRRELANQQSQLGAMGSHNKQPLAGAQFDGRLELSSWFWRWGRRLCYW
ncbi:GH12920 [Drosophila grimshawi]|uniref:GH12920 n=1 Tax=Drosophila grimshawi TaxID=7222 RepID=B4JIU4_DROGR|nr:GH12920 [Drosophila grimshawi]